MIFLLLQGVDDVNLKRYLRWANTGQLNDPANKAPAAGGSQLHEQAAEQPTIASLLLMAARVHR